MTTPTMNADKPKKEVHLISDPDIIEEVEQVAAQERRSRNQMIQILLEDALRLRRSRASQG